MKNLFISDLHEKDVEHCTTDFGLKIRREIDKPFKKACNVFTNANIIREQNDYISDEEYYNNLSEEYVNPSIYNINPKKNNIIVERYSKLNPNEPYIFVCNHTCPEDIETVLNIIDRNAYLVLGSIEALQTNPEMYLTFVNGMIPFDILNENQRKLVFEKMKRVIRTNSILIFPEGSHNYNPNNLINPLFDGPVNLALQTNTKIVPISLIREENISYIDVGNPIDVKTIGVNMNKEFEDSKTKEKYYVNSLTAYIRDVMATGVYNIISRHYKTISRYEDDQLEEQIRMSKILDSFKKLKWNKDIFDAEFLVKVTKSEKDLLEVATTITNLILNGKIELDEYNKEWFLVLANLENKNVAKRMSMHLHEIEQEKTKSKRRNY